MEVPTGDVNCVAALDDGHVLTGSEDKTVNVWRARTPRPANATKDERGPRVRADACRIPV